MKALITSAIRFTLGAFLLLSILDPSAAVAQQNLSDDLQPAYSTPAVIYGVRANLNVTDFYGSDAGSPEADARLGAGVFMNYRFLPYLAVQPEVLYSARAARTSRVPAVDGARHARFEMGYVDVPVLLRAYLPQQVGAEPHLSAGPYFSYRLHARARDANQVLNDEHLNDLMRKTDYGIMVGGGLDRLTSRGKASFDVRYTFGLSRLFDTEDRPDFRQRGVMFSLGVGFRPAG